MSNYDGRIEPLLMYNNQGNEQYLSSDKSDTDEVLSPDEEVIHDQNKRIELLQEQLKEANEVIKFYSDARQLTEEEKQMSAEKYHLVYGLKANDYLDKWGVK